MANKKNPRLAAVTIFSSLLKQQGSLASLIPQYKNDFSTQEQSFLRELCFGAARHYPVLSALLNQLLKQPLKKKDSDITAVLLLGLYQLAFTRVADHAAVNESVNLTTQLKKVWAKKLVNGVLRRFTREHEALLAAATKASPFNHPEWLVKKIQRHWPDQAEAIFNAANSHPPMTLRIHSQKTTQTDYLALLEKQSIEAQAAPFSTEGIYLTEPLPVDQLPHFSEGWVSVQDEAAQLSARLLDLKPNQRVLDACCAPGGKTCHIGETEPQLKSLVALDIEPRRLTRVQENLERTGVKANVIAADASQTDSWWDGIGFDRILLDAPCSATGIIRRQPDIKLLRDEQQIKDLTKIQLSLLSALWPLLNPGGILLYATCSIMPEENTQMIEQFLQVTADAVYDPLHVDWGVPQAFGQQLLPTINGHDGFFYARLKKA